MGGSWVDMDNVLGLRIFLVIRTMTGLRIVLSKWKSGFAYMCRSRIV